MAAAKELIYQNITATGETVGDMRWEDINKKVYGATGLTSTTFWSRYGGGSDTYEVKIRVKQKDDTWKDLEVKNLSANTVQTFTIEGVKTRINLNSTETETAYVQVSTDNTVKTQNTYKNVDGKGAHYQVIITIKADNNYSYKNVVMTQDFYVKDVCAVFSYNPLYHYDSYGTYNNCVVVKGQKDATTNTWVMSSKVKEHFLAKNGRDIFQYYADEKNVTAISFAWKTGETGVTPAGAQTAPFTVALSHAMTSASEVHNMTYQTTLVNNEHCDYNYNIVFVNPFTAGTAKGISIFANGVGARTGETAPQVKVIESNAEARAIYEWSTTANKLQLTAIGAGEPYYLAEPESVTYAFDKSEADYKTLTSNMTSAAKLEVDTNGQVTWENGGTQLKDNFNLTVIATVTFKDLSVVKCRIPVVLSATK